MVQRIAVSQWAKAGLVAMVVAAWPTYALLTERGRPASDPSAEVAKLDYTLKDMHGKAVRLAEFKGRPLVVNFWATWCTPCKHEIPSFVALVDKYRDQNLTVLGISTDDSPEDLRTFAAEFKINYPVLVGLGMDELIEAYEAEMMIPVTWFIRRDGTVALKHAGTQTREWFERQITALF
jgi:cytochrome c biogenesis protein CcmG/thiol:disulfide interchange protein DsbE